jgi:hypothetical protein
LAAACSQGPTSKRGAIAKNFDVLSRVLKGTVNIKRVDAREAGQTLKQLYGQTMADKTQAHIF